MDLETLGKGKYVSLATFRGNVQRAAVAGHATLQGQVDTAVTASMIATRYGLVGRFFSWMNDRRARGAGRTGEGQVGLVITLDG